MDNDTSDSPKAPGARMARGGSEPVPRQPDLPQPDPGSQDLAQEVVQEAAAADLDPASAGAEDDDEERLPEVAGETSEAGPEGPLAVGHAAIEHAVRHAPTSPGVYRILNAANDVLYVGKAKNVRKRLSSYARIAAIQPARILRMTAL